MTDLYVLVGLFIFVLGALVYDYYKSSSREWGENE